MILPARSRLASAWPSFGGFVKILKRDQEPLHRPQWAKSEHGDERQPQRCVYPEWRLIQDFRHQSRGDDDEASEEDNEDRRAVTGIGEIVVEPAGGAARAQRDKALEQFAIAAHLHDKPANAAAERVLIVLSIT